MGLRCFLILCSSIPSSLTIYKFFVCVMFVPIDRFSLEQDYIKQLLYYNGFMSVYYIYGRLMVRVLLCPLCLPHHSGVVVHDMLLLQWCHGVGGNCGGRGCSRNSLARWSTWMSCCTCPRPASLPPTSLSEASARVPAGVAATIWCGKWPGDCSIADNLENRRCKTNRKDRILGVWRSKIVAVG